MKELEQSSGWEMVLEGTQCLTVHRCCSSCAKWLDDVTSVISSARCTSLQCYCRTKIYTFSLYLLINVIISKQRVLSYVLDSSKISHAYRLCSFSLFILYLGSSISFQSYDWANVQNFQVLVLHQTSRHACLWASPLTRSYPFAMPAYLSVSNQPWQKTWFSSQLQRFTRCYYSWLP